MCFDLYLILFFIRHTYTQIHTHTNTNTYTHTWKRKFYEETAVKEFNTHGRACEDRHREREWETEKERERGKVREWDREWVFSGRLFGCLEKEELWGGGRRVSVVWGLHKELGPTDHCRISTKILLRYTYKGGRIMI